MYHIYCHVAASDQLLAKTKHSRAALRDRVRCALSLFSVLLSRLLDTSDTVVHIDDDLTMPCETKIF